jgi:hypothetical protein
MQEQTSRCTQAETNHNVNNAKYKILYQNVVAKTFIQRIKHITMTHIGSHPSQPCFLKKRTKTHLSSEVLSQISRVGSIKFVSVL